MCGDAPRAQGPGQGHPRTTRDPLGPAKSQEPPKSTKGGPRAARRAPGAATTAPREPQEAPGGLPDPQKTMKNAVLSTKFGFSAERDFRAAQRAPKSRPGGALGPPQERPRAAQARPKSSKSGPDREGPGAAQE